MSAICFLQHYDRSSPLERHNIRTVQVSRLYECSMPCAAERLRLRQLGGCMAERPRCMVLLVVVGNVEIHSFLGG